MKKRMFSLLAALALALLLTACGPEAPAPVDTTPPPETSPASEPARALTQEEVAAVNEAFASWTEEEVRTHIRLLEKYTECFRREIEKL